MSIAKNQWAVLVEACDKDFELPTFLGIVGVTLYAPPGEWPGKVGSNNDKTNSYKKEHISNHFQSKSSLLFKLRYHFVEICIVW